MRCRPTRASWVVHFGIPPQCNFVVRTCTTDNCVAPHHLTLHKWPHLRTGYHAKGADNGNASLTPDAVREIRESSERPSRLAEKYGVNVSNICHIRSYRTWKHVDP